MSLPINTKKNLTEKQQSFLENLIETKEDLNQRRSEELAAVIEKARAVIKKIAEKEKFDLIVENAVYAAPTINITEKVIKALNAKK